MPDAPEIRLTARWVAAAMSGPIASGDAGQAFAGVSIDTRTLKPGDLFVAIRGERFDGADFAAAALRSGAAGVVVPRGRASGSSPPAAVIEVEDTTAALQALAHAVRVDSGARVVAITGSAGKTTTKEITAEFLASRYRVIRNRGNFNNHIGLPLSLLELRWRPEIAVVELGMSHTGEISTLVRVAEPDVRVWTNVGDAHLGFFSSIAAIADAKAEILERATETSVLVANADDDLVMARAAHFAGRVVTFATARDADVRAVDIEDRGVDGIRATVSTPRGRIDLSTPLVGRGNLCNVLAAAAVALEFDVSLDAIAQRAGHLRAATHRGEVIRLARGVTVIDDSYNANPTATRVALDLLSRTMVAGRRVAVLGEMLELGAMSDALHQEVGRAAARSAVDVLLAIGGSPAGALAEAARAAGVPDVRHFAASGEAAEAAPRLIGAGDVVLVKGSRGVRTDLVVDRLKAEFA